MSLFCTFVTVLFYEVTNIRKSPPHNRPKTKKMIGRTMQINCYLIFSYFLDFSIGFFDKNEHFTFEIAGFL